VLGYSEQEKIYHVRYGDQVKDIAVSDFKGIQKNIMKIDKEVIGPPFLITQRNLYRLLLI